MKQILLKGMVTRLLGLLVTFFMIASMDGRAQTTRSVGSTDNWNDAVSSLLAGDIIQLTADITMGNIPGVACTVTSDNGQRTLTYGSNLEMTAPLTFKNIKLAMSCIYANGYALVFDEGVECVATYGDGITGLRNIWGGSASNNTVTSTSVTLKSGTFGWIYAGGDQGSVTGEANLDLSGSVKVNGTVFGGGNAVSATCGSTHVEISGGTYGYINGGGWSGNVTGECYLKISGTPTITGNVFGGSNQLGTTVGSTRVEIAGGTFKDGGIQTIGGAIFAGGWGCTVQGNTSIIATGGTMGYLYGGCSQGKVEGEAYVEVNGATLDGGLQDDMNKTPNPASIYGSGFGDGNPDGGYDEDNGKVGSSRIVVKSLTPGTAGVILYGGGLYAGVRDNTDVTIEGGTFMQVWGSSHVESPDYKGSIGGNVNVLVKGGEIGLLGAARGQMTGESVPVGGDMNLTIEGGTITQQINSGNAPDGKDYKPCTLTIRNQGNETTPFLIPKTYAISNIVLEGTTVTEFRKPEIVENINIALYSLYIHEDHPTEISGSGKLKGEVLLTNLDGKAELPTDKALVVGGEQLKDADLKIFKSYSIVNGVANVTTTPVYKAGNTYRSNGTTTLRTVTITNPANGKFSVVWDKVGERNTELENGDKIPVNTKLTLSVVPDEGYQGGTILANDGKITGSTYTVTGDVTFTVGDITAIPYTVTVAALTNGSISATPNTDVTIGTTVNLSITPDDGYRLKSGSLKVYKTDDANTPVTLSGNSFNMPAYNVTVTAEFENIPTPPTPTPDPVYYTVTLPSVEGATTDPAGGVYDVESWDSFRFYLTLDKEYDQSEPIVTTSRGETIQPRTSDGAYILKYVRSDVEVFIDGIVKNPDPVANTELQSGIKAWTNDHRLFIRTDRPEDVVIYTFAGKLRKAFWSEGGEEEVPLASGSYIICIGGECFKVIL